MEPEPTDPMTRLRLGILTLALTATGCGLAERTAFNTMVPIIDNAVVAAYRNGDAELVEEGLPGNLLIVDGLLETRPNDKRLLTLGAQLYFSYGVAFIEPRNPDRAMRLYETAMRYGFRTFPELDPELTGGREGTERFQAALDELESEDVPALCWLSGAWGSWIKLNLSRPAALIQLDRVEALLARVIELDATYLYGLPHVMLGSALALRPAGLGGDPDRALAHFDEAFAASDRRFLLVHVFFAQYYCRQVFDEELFDRTLEEIAEADPDALPDVRLLNVVARDQARTLAQRRDDWF